MEVKEYSEEFHRQWDDFIRTSSRNGGIFQERDFLSYHAEEKFKDASILFFEEGELIAVFPAAEIKEDQITRIISHPGSSYGGLIYKNDSTLRDILDILEQMILYYIERNICSLEMRLSEPIFHKLPDGELIYLLWHRGFALKTQEISSCLDLTENKGWEKLSRKRNLTYIRKLEREGVIAEETEDIEDVYHIIEKNLTTRYNRIPTHSLAELKKIKELYPGRVHFWRVIKEGISLGAIVLFDVSDTGVHDFYIARNEDVQDIKALQLLFHKVFEHYHEKNFRWFNFGISSRNEQIKWGILEFKEAVGGRATVRQSWILENLAAYKKYEEL